MAPLELWNLPSLRRQHLLAEFSSLKQACPEGVFVSLTPGDPSLWTGVVFVRKGPYANAILRFHISFPDSYPDLPPLVTFSTDVFHPLITPLTTYMYTTDIQHNGTVSATDEERLPPGGFSLRHGFPSWFGRGSGSRQTSGQQRPAPVHQTPSNDPPGSGASATSTPLSKVTPPLGPPSFMRMHKKAISTYEVLRYIRSTFDDEDVLDSVPQEASGNPGAWHAWRTRQRACGKVLPDEAARPAQEGAEGDDKDKPGMEQGAVMSPSKGAAAGMAVKRPGEWNWEGVWEERVKKGIATSLSDPVLFGNAGAGDDVIRFLSMEDSDVETVKDNLLRTLGASSV